MKKFIKAFVIWHIYICVVLNILSYYRAISYLTVILIFLVGIAATVIAEYRSSSRLSMGCGGLNAIWKDSSIVERCLILLIAAISVCMGIVAICAIPYEYDSLTHYAPRIMMWAQNRSVMPYPSHISRQVNSPELASYVTLVMYILGGFSERMLTLPQYMAYIIAAALIYSISRRLCTSKTFSLLAVVLWMTLPITFAEAITCQNDIYATLWLVMLVYLALDGENNSLGDVAVMAACVGLGYITKPSVCFGMLIIMIWYLVILIEAKVGLRKIVIQLLVGFAVCSAIVLPGMIRNIVLFGKISADNTGKRQLVGTLMPNYMLVNWLKNLLYNFGFKVGPISSVEAVKKLVLKVANAVNVDINHESISENALPFSYPSMPTFSSSSALNFLASVLILLSLIVIIRNYKKLSIKVKQYSVVALCSMLLFLLFLRWEMSITRYMIAYFALTFPMIAAVLEYLYANRLRSFYVISAICIPIFLMELSGEVLNLIRIHPVFVHKSNYVYIPGGLDDYEETCSYINNLGEDTIGLIETEVTYDYPLWPLLADNVKLVHIKVRNNTSVLETEYQDIETILVSEDCYSEDEIEYNGRVYQKRHTNDFWKIYQVLDE